ncbi:hypothetical protein Tco_1540851 [Tanacetum coccineum]
MCKAYSGDPSIDLLRSFLNLGHAEDWLTLSSRGGADVPKALTKPVTHLENWKGLKTSWKYSPKKPMDFRSFMIQGVDGEFNFLPEGDVDGNQSFTKSVNNEALVINVDPIFVVHPYDVTENIVDSHNISADKGELSLIGPDAPSYLEEGKRLTVAGKRKVVCCSHGEGPPATGSESSASSKLGFGDASSPLMLIVTHIVTPPDGAWAEYVSGGVTTLNISSVKHKE